MTVERGPTTNHQYPTCKKDQRPTFSSSSNRSFRTCSLDRQFQSSPSSPVTTQNNSPVNGWTRETYGPNFQAIRAQGVPHNIPTQERDVLDWFGITGNLFPSDSTTVGPTSTATTPTTTTTATTPTTTQPAGPLQTQYGQCGG